MGMKVSLRKGIISKLSIGIAYSIKRNTYIVHEDSLILENLQRLCPLCCICCGVCIHVLSTKGFAIKSQAGTMIYILKVPITFCI
jgi:hypothetical protein